MFGHAAQRTAPQVRRTAPPRTRRRHRRRRPARAAAAAPRLPPRRTAPCGTAAGVATQRWASGCLDLAHSTHIVRTSPSAQCEAPKGPARPTNMGQRTPGCRPHLISRSWPVCKRRMKSTLGRRPGCVSRLADIQLTVIYSAVCCRCRRFVQARRPAGRLATAATCRAPRQDTVSQMGQQAGLLALMHNNAARCSRGTYSSA